MSTANVSASEGNLLNVLDSISPLVWRRYQQRYPQVWRRDHFETEDHSHVLPFVAFRFERQDDSIVARLRLAIEGYRGKVNWSLREHNRAPLAGSNWIVEPSRLADVADKANQEGLSPKEYFAQHEPDAGIVAYEDLVGLTEHVRLAFS